MNYYLIRYMDKKFIILAKTSYQAVEHWVKVTQNEREKEGRRVPFNPSNFSVEDLGYELLEASN